MKPLRTFSVIPSLPEPLAPLRDLAQNLRWAWNHDTIELFRRLDSDLWEASGHNPVLMLGTIPQDRLDQVIEDPGFMAHLARVNRDFQTYLEEARSTWFLRTHERKEQPVVAYFSAEFGLTECLSIFAGGLGILSGDHLKSASDLDIPLVGVGLLYQQGYFEQYLNQAGWQQERYVNNDFNNLPVTLERQADGTPLMIAVEMADRVAKAQIWRVDVGRIPLYLLDTNVPGNAVAERDITDQLYGGDQETRIRQEIMLGIGGYHALEALGLTPKVYHVNEGHSAFLILERIRDLMQSGLSFTEAREAASSGTVFTTHTPVPAGHDRFPAPLMQRYFKPYAAQLNLSWHNFMALGRENPNNHSEPFCMTILAVRLAAYTNGVAELHAKVSREMWQGLWPTVPQEEIPITHVTNGVHFLSWISQDMKELYDRYLGPRWREEPADQQVWQRAEQIAAEELWRTHGRRRARLVAFARRQLRTQLARRGAAQSEIKAAEEVLDPHALTIGFARRFATYKRATLILRNPDRLARILNDPERPVQIIFAGKAHPRDNPGKSLIQQIVSLAHKDRFRQRLVFLEDYDMTMARYLLQGCDVWLNTPRRPREASGTSGMKAAANGVLNISILDGWWDEAYTPEVGWAIGRGEIYADHDYQDHVESEALYDLLERDVVPMFYERDASRLPRAWIDHMKADISALCHFFNTNRMVAEYTERFYMPCVRRYTKLTADGLTGAKTLAQWRNRIKKAWGNVRVENVEVNLPEVAQVGDAIQARAWVHLGELDPQDVRVELYLGKVDANGQIVDGEAIPMAFIPVEEGRGYFKLTTATCQKSGLHGYTVRVLPHHPLLITPFLPGYIIWAQ